MSPQRLEEAKASRTDTLRRIRAAAFHLAKFLPLFRRTYGRPFVGHEESAEQGPGAPLGRVFTADDVAEQIQGWLVMSTGASGVGLDESWYEDIDFVMRSMTERLNGHRQRFSSASWRRHEQRDPESKASSPPSSPMTLSPGSPAGSAASRSPKRKGTKDAVASSVSVSAVLSGWGVSLGAKPKSGQQLEEKTP